VSLSARAPRRTCTERPFPHRHFLPGPEANGRGSVFQARAYSSARIRLMPHPPRNKLPVRAMLAFGEEPLCKSGMLPIGDEGRLSRE